MCAGNSCLDLLQSGNTADGVYMIAARHGRASAPVYCDMTRDGGGWTLLASNIGSDLHEWTSAQVAAFRKAHPSITADYSNLAIGDQIKDTSLPTLQYRLEANSFGQQGGIFSAPSAYSFLRTTDDQNNVTVNKWFPNTAEFSNDGIKKRMPYWRKSCTNANVSGCGMLTSASGDENMYGTLIFSTKKVWTPAPWDVTQARGKPGSIWYWVRERQPGAHPCLSGSDSARLSIRLSV